MTPPCRPRLLAIALSASLFWLAGCATSPPADSASSADSAQSPQAAASAPASAASAAEPIIVLSAADLQGLKDEDGPAVAAPIDPLRPDVRIDLDDRTAQTDLWSRVRQGFAMPDLDTDLVREREQWYAARPDYVQRMTERGGRYLYHILEEVDKRGLPTELALLPFIESAFNPQALSVANASGMWQFVPSTGRDFSLKQNIFRDDRRDVLASTRAALDYLTRLHDEFQDWHLTLAAYNWGVGNVRRAIARNQHQGLPTDYLSLRMPEETRNYVPKLQAVKNIILHPETFALQLPELENHPYFLSVPIERDMDVELAARLAGLKIEEFKQLNPQMNKPVILAAGTPQVLLPYDNANVFVRNIDKHHGPLASWTAWVAPRTMRPADVAKQMGMTEASLRDINHIPPRMLVKAGSTLLVPRTERRADDVPESLADNAMVSFAPDLPPQRRISLKAGRKGESVASVARRYHLSATQVAQWNKVSATGSFKPGQAIALYVGASASRVSTSGTASAPAHGSRMASSRSAPAKVASARPAKASASHRKVASAHGEHGAVLRVADSQKSPGL